MGWFDEQIRIRVNSDNEAFADAFGKIAEAVDGEKVSVQSAKGAVAEIAGVFGVPEALLEHDTLEDIFGPCGVMRRTVELTDGWYKDAAGVYLATTKAGDYAALIPDWRGYTYRDYDTGKTVRVNASTQKELKAEAVCFYRPLPAEKLGVKDLLSFAAKCISLYDIVYIALVTLAAVLVSMIPPYLTRIIYTHAIHTQNIGALASLIVFMSCAGISAALLTVSKMLLLARIQLKTNTSLNAAVMMRVINLPAEFFRKYSAGELAQRVSGTEMLCSMGAEVIFSAALTALMSLVYLQQIFAFAPSLVFPALCIVSVMAALAVLSAWWHTKLLKRRTKLRAEEYGLLYALITGIQKIRLTGSEKRAFSKWAGHYSKDAKLEYNPPLFLKLTNVIQPVVMLAGTFLLYRAAWGAKVQPAEYMAFTVSYGMLSGAFTALCGVTLSMAMIGPMADMIRPVLEEVPEISQGRTPARVRGGIEVNSVTFRYSAKSPLVLDKISFRVKLGEYVAIVGKSGCGKSTLMRLLLGFDTPDSGVIYYDSSDIKTLNLRALRRSIGCVMQNSRLFPGSIYSNIVISAPHLTEADAWQAAEMAGIADDIRRMPMKMHTLISEGAGTISGGQRQRIIIARAIAPKPKILLFDEATSALDNITQRIVSESLDGLKCTRIVIAHRLSTVRHCGRILVIDGGRIAEEGSYDDLMSRKGLFASLVERQRTGGTK
ncbi:MAG: ATP-binding cassette domain-containing protein [Synergistaceae bacterium]|nr:ATP-binding cassette domain-containing protein [Synergistaceae bacterium]